MDPQIVAIIVAVIGSSGIVGALTLAIQHSRAVRLRRSIREALDLATALENETRAAGALRTAAKLDAYRLAAMSLVQWGGFMVTYVLLVIASMLFIAFVGRSLVYDADALWTGPFYWSAYWLALIAAYVAAADALLRMRRDQLVKRLTEPGSIRVTVKMIGSVVEQDRTSHRPKTSRSEQRRPPNPVQKGR